MKVRNCTYLVLMAAMLSACSMNNSSSFGFSDIVKLREYDYKTSEKASLNLFDMHDYKFDISDEKFYAKKTINFDSPEIRLSKALNSESKGSAFAGSGGEMMLSSY